MHHILSNVLTENGQKQAFIVNTGLPKLTIVTGHSFSLPFFPVKELLNVIQHINI